MRNKFSCPTCSATGVISYGTVNYAVASAMAHYEEWEFVYIVFNIVEEYWGWVPGNEWDDLNPEEYRIDLVLRKK